jgi:hypothetical protein
VPPEWAVKGSCHRWLALSPDRSILLCSSATTDGELLLGTGVIRCGLHQAGITTAANMLRKSALLSGPDSPTPPAFLDALPLISGQAMAA